MLAMTLLITFLSGANFFALLFFWPTQAYNVYGKFVKLLLRREPYLILHDRERSARRRASWIANWFLYHWWCRYIPVPDRSDKGSDSSHHGLLYCVDDGW